MGNLQVITRKEEENNREYAYRFLLYNIMCMKMAPGDVIKENEIAQLLNISRTPVHEAVLMLKENFLADVLPQSSSKVSLVNLEMMREGYFIRNTIEPIIIRQLAGNVSPNILRLLRNNLDKQEEISRNPNKIEEFFVLDDEFHGIIYTAAKKEHIWMMVKGVSSHFDRVRHMYTILMSGDRVQYTEEHQQIYQYLMLGLDSKDDLESFYEKHIGSFKKDFNNMLNKYSDYFQI